ncbi:transposase (plasmid) [Cupriavidus necator]|nr:transposase [Cupriavidus necator]
MAQVFNELKSRGCQDILITVVDGLKKLTEAVATAYPRMVQACIVHWIRNSMDYASYKERRCWHRRWRPSPTARGAPSTQDRAVVDAPGSTSYRSSCFRPISGGR